VGRGEPIAALTRHILAQARRATTRQLTASRQAWLTPTASTSPGCRLVGPWLLVAGLYLYLLRRWRAPEPSGAAHDMMSAFKAMGSGAKSYRCATDHRVSRQRRQDRSPRKRRQHQRCGCRRAGASRPDIGQEPRRAHAATREASARRTRHYRCARRVCRAVAGGVRPARLVGRQRCGSYTDPDGFASKAMLDFFCCTQTQGLGRTGATPIAPSVTA
jgi:hypothetical protein